MKTFKAYIKPFEAPQSSVEIKIELNFFTLSGIGTLRVNTGIFGKTAPSCFVENDDEAKSVN